MNEPTFESVSGNVTIDQIQASISKAHNLRVEKLIAQVREQNPEPLINQAVAQWVIQNQNHLRAALEKDPHYNEITPAVLYRAAADLINALKGEAEVLVSSEDKNISQYLPLNFGLVSVRSRTPGPSGDQYLYIYTPTDEAKALYEKCFGNVSQGIVSENK